MTKSVFTRGYKHFRKMIVQARKASGLKQTELAARLGRPQSYVSKFERGERRLDLIEFLEVADAVKIDVAAFIRKLKRVTSKDRPRRP